MRSGAGEEHGTGERRGAGGQDAEQHDEPRRPEPFDLDALAREQPSWRLHRAHPALGLLAAEEAGEEPPGIAEARDFGFKWLRLPDAEQRQRERDFTAALLRHAARADRAEFMLAPWASDATRAVLRTLPEVLWDEHGICWGPLTDDVVDVLARRACDGLFVYRDGAAFLAEAAGGPARTGLCIWLDPWRSGELRTELEEAWWPAAEARAAERRAGGEVAPRDGGRVSRETRAAILQVWDQRGWTTLRVAALLAFTLLLSDTWYHAALVLAVALTIAILIDRRLKRWHRRS